MGEPVTVHHLFDQPDVDEGLPENPSHLRPADFNLVMGGYDIIQLWEERLITADTAVLLIFYGLRQAYRGQGLNSGPLKIENFDVPIFATNWESPVDDNGKAKRFKASDIMKVAEKLGKAHAGCDLTRQLSLELNL